MEFKFITNKKDEIKKAKVEMDVDEALLFSDALIELYNSPYIHENDKPTVLKMLADIKAGKVYVQSEED